MATARQRDDRADGPAGWMVLLALMVLALVIAWSSKGCGSSDPNAGLGGSSTQTTTNTATTKTATTSNNVGQNVITEITNSVTKSGGIQFQTAAADLTADGKSALDSVAKILSRNPTVNVRIEGHTDTQGNADTNRTLSKRRADAVRDYLVGKGIALTRLTTQGFGEDQPLIPNDTTEAARRQNRRVEFKLSQ